MTEELGERDALVSIPCKSGQVVQRADHMNEQRIRELEFQSPVNRGKSSNIVLTLSFREPKKWVSIPCKSGQVVQLIGYPRLFEKAQSSMFQSPVNRGKSSNPSAKYLLICQEVTESFFVTQCPEWPTTPITATSESTDDAEMQKF